jgi:catechol 2,3-dioxygenase-like lactoylglutathione lyase family enzyme
VEILSSRVIVHPADLARSRRFYEDVVGLRIYREWSVGAAYFLGGGFLELSSVGSERAEAGGRATLWLQVPSLDGVEAALRAVGTVVGKPTEVMPWGLIELWVEDPDGNELRFVEVPPTHPLRRR